MNPMHILLAALSLVESNNRDYAKGASGEVSRYQIMPYVWKAETTSKSWHSHAASRVVAERILAKRINYFTKQTHRLPTPQEVYALWNKPGRFETCGWNWLKLDKKTRARCERYAQAVRTVLAKEELKVALDNSDP